MKLMKSIQCTQVMQSYLHHYNVMIMKSMLFMALLMIVIALQGCHQEASTVLQEEGQGGISSASVCNQLDAPFAVTVCQITPAELKKSNASLGLFWLPQSELTAQGVQSSLQQKERIPLLTFSQLADELHEHHHELVFAMNAGMYNQDFAPIGYTVIQGQQVLSLNLKEGGGNFHLLPNGVFWWDKKGFYITESQKMNRLLYSGKVKPEFATQSGPMLVINGKIHPKFSPNSDSKKIRNGVGVCRDGYVKFAISDEPVNFYHFAQFFKQTLQCNEALFLDGGVASALYAPHLHRQDSKNMGVMIGLVEPQPSASFP